MLRSQDLSTAFFVLANSFQAPENPLWKSSQAVTKIRMERVSREKEVTYGKGKRRKHTRIRCLTALGYLPFSPI